HDASFDKVFTVNTIYFWKSLEAGFAEIHRVLKPGGRAVIGFVVKERMDQMKLPADIFTSRTPQEVLAAMESAGFREIRVERPRPTTPWCAVVGHSADACGFV